MKTNPSFFLNMQVVILAGGFGTRLGNLTTDIPKPMVKLGHYPILLHIINHFYSFGFREYILCLGYKQEVIKEYFMRMKFFDNDLFIKNGKTEIIKPLSNNLFPEAEFKLIDTGLKSNTAERLIKANSFINKEKPFFLTYGDGISSVDLDDLLKFHDSHNGCASVTSVHPNARFGEIISNNNGLVESFKEKPAVQNSWINGGFFIFDQEIFDYIDHSNNEMLEQGPLERLVEKNQLYSYKFEGYWRCLDTPRDLKLITEEVNSRKYPYYLSNY